MRRRHATLSILLLRVLLVGGTGLWLRAQQRQYALNRQLIAALVKGDDKHALALINEGADPNTRYLPLPKPSLKRMCFQLLHGFSLPVNNSATAFSLACGAWWNRHDLAILKAQIHRPDTTQMLQVMLAHGAHVNEQDQDASTPDQDTSTPLK